MGFIASLLIGADQRTVFKDSEGNTDLLVLDVTKNITPKYSSTVTEHPVEEGRGITDHIRPNNIELTLEGYVSETPLNLNSSIAGLVTSAAGSAGSRIGGSLIGSAAAVAGGIGASLLLGSSDKSAASRDFLISLIEEKKTFRLAAPSLSKKYNDAVYVMTSVVFPKDANTGKGLAFTATIKQIRIVSTVTVPIGKLKNAHSSAEKSKLGKQAAKEAEPGKRKSFLKAIAGSFS